jgi:hypothetical protein
LLSPFVIVQLLSFVEPLAALAVSGSCLEDIASWITVMRLLCIRVDAGLALRGD